MYNNQDIFRIDFSKRLNNLYGCTNLLLFPLRLETKIKEKTIEVCDKPEAALYIFKALWQLLLAIDKVKNAGASTSVADAAADALLGAAIDQQTMYREDKARIIDILELTANQHSEYADKIKDIKAEIDKMAVAKNFSDNRATDLIKKAKFLYSHLYKPAYNGTRRTGTTVYSITQYYEKYARDLEKAIAFLNDLEYRIKRIPFIDNRQYKALTKCLQGLSDFNEIFDTYYKSQPGIYMIVKKGYEDGSQKLDVNRRIYAFDVFNERYELSKGNSGGLKCYGANLEAAYRRICRFETGGYLGNADTLSGGLMYEYKQALAPIDWILANLRASRVRDAKGKSVHRYTSLAHMMMRWKLQNIIDPKYTLDKNTSLFEAARRISAHSLFHYGAEMQWMHEVLDHYNSFCSDSDTRISPDRLKSYSKCILLGRKLKTTKKAKCLCIRIYPDELLLTQLNRKITKQEQKDAIRFLEEYNYAELKQVEDYKFKYADVDLLEKTTDYHQAAWDRICRNYPPYRAAWIARCVATDNVEIDEENQIFTIPVCKLLPTRFAVQAVVKHSKTRTSTIYRYGNRLPEVLQMGINFNDKNTTIDTLIQTSNSYGLKFKERELKWMTDYDEAEKLGLAITIPLDSVKAVKKATKYKPKYITFESIYVTGIRQDDGNYANELAELFQARLYSPDGLDLIKTGTPTNIIGDDEGTTFNSAEERQSQMFYNVIKHYAHKYIPGWIRFMGEDDDSIKAAHRANIDDYLKSDAYRLEEFLSDRMSITALDETQNADKRDNYNSRIVNQHLLEHFARKGHPLFIALNLEPYKSFFLNYVSARGLYSCLRCGAQPYGIVPVSDFRSFNFGFSHDIGLLNKIIYYLSSKWNEVADRNRVIEKKSDGEEFLRLMGKTHTACNFDRQESIKIANLLNPNYFKGARNTESLENEFKFHVKLEGTNINIESVLENFDYIPLLEEQFTRKLDNDEMDQATSELIVAVHNLLYPDDKVSAETSPLDIPLERREEIRPYIYEFFDLFTHRLDAWITGLMYYQIKKNKEDYSDNGLQSIVEEKPIAIGCYGWVFDLVDKADAKVSQDLNEYILAPSLAQAQTAAILRGAFINRDAAGEDSEEVNINLSSARVRKAIRLIEGIRNGLPIGAILGADLERLLHDAYKTNKVNGEAVEMDEYIWPLRQAFPLVESELTRLSDSKELLKQTPNVLNGAQLIKNLRTLAGDVDNVMNIGEYFAPGRNFKKFQEWCGKIGLPTDNTAVARGEKEKVLLACIQEIYDSYDALADVAMSDSIYHLCQGNTDAAAAVMSALNNEQMLPMPAVTEIPMNHVRIENKVMTMFRAEEKVIGSYLETLEVADLHVKEWIEQVLHDFELTDFITPTEYAYLSTDIESLKEYIKYHGGDEEKVEQYAFIATAIRDMLGQARAVGFEDLMQESPAVAVEEWYDAADLKNRYAYILREVNRLSDDIDPCVLIADNMAEDQRAILSTENPMPISQVYAAKCSLADKYIGFRKKAIPLLWEAYRSGITTAVTGMCTHGLLDKSIENTPEEVVYDATLSYDDKMKDTRVNKQELVRSKLEEIDFKGLATYMHSISEELQQRLDKAKQYLYDENGTKKVEESNDRLNADGKDAYINAIQALTLTYAKVVPLAIMDDVEFEDFEGEKQRLLPVEQIGDQLDSQQMPDDDIVDDYLSQMSNLRPTMQSLYMQLMYSAMAGNTSDTLQFKPLQLPCHYVTENGRKKMVWLGSGEGVNEELLTDTNVYAVTNPERMPHAIADSYKVRGLVIDFWAEKIPLRDQTAGLTFYYDQPDAEPPQAILLAVNSGKKNSRTNIPCWSELKLLKALKSVKHQVKCRSVEPDDLYADSWAGGLLPLVNVDLDRDNKADNK